MRDLGPVAEADLGLRPLTLLVGHPNTGKSVVLKALYAALKTADRFHRDAIGSVTADELDAAAAAMPQRPPGSHPVEAELRSLPEPARARISQWVTDGVGDGTELLDAALRDCFDVQRMAQARRWGAAGADPAVELVCTRRAPPGERDTAAVPDMAAAAAAKFLWPAALTAAGRDPVVLAALSQQLARSACRRYSALCAATGSAHYLPDGRAGLMRVWETLDGAQHQPAGASGGLPGVVADFVAAMAGTQHPPPAAEPSAVLRAAGCALDSEQHRPMEAFAAVDVLRQAMGGDIRARTADRRGGASFEADDGNRTPLRHAGSAVRELAPLVIWAETLLRRGDTLIVEEPEEGLPRSAVRRTALALVRLVNAGVAVACSTHSTVLLHEISNCILRDAAERRTSTHDTAGDRLAAGMVAAYQFRRCGPDSGVKASAVPITPDAGIPAGDNMRVARSAADDTRRLLARLA